MILLLADLSEEPREFSGEEPAEMYEWVDSPMEVVHPSGAVKWRCLASMFGGRVLVRGHFDAPFAGICCRCGCDMEICISDSFDIAADTLRNDTEVDLTSELRECILLSLPSHPVCDPDCRGVCPHCGKRLADGPCGCGNDFGMLFSGMPADFPEGGADE